MGTVWPFAKHQLCFWHALRALKQRLARTKEKPGPYNAQYAHQLFNFIKVTFVPTAQQPFGAQLDQPPEQPLPRIRLTLNGRPSVITPSLTIRIPLRQSMSDEQATTARSNIFARDPDNEPSEDFDLVREADAILGKTRLPTQSVDSGSGDERSDAGDFWADRAMREERGEELERDEAPWEFDEDDGWSDDEEEDLRHGVNKIRDVEDADEASIAGVEDSGPSNTRPSHSYIFCPAPHRLTIMRLFAKHASQHPLLPERHGQPRTAELIYRDAVQEMYQHCEANRLCEVWAYLWNSWYSPEKWKIWARSAYAASIPVHRTTMMVEALWRNLKRLTLNMYNRPPLDLATHALITRSLPSSHATFSSILTTRAGGRPSSLTHMQMALKRSWMRLLTVPIKGSYITKVETWTCDCGAQKYHAFLLCKHLVQAVGQLPADWWIKATRYHLPPFYTIPLHGRALSPPESRRSYDWISRMDSRARDAVLMLSQQEQGTPEPMGALLSERSSPVSEVNSTPTFRGVSKAELDYVISIKAATHRT